MGLESLKRGVGAVLLLCLGWSTALADYPVEVIQLKTRSAQEMIPLITPFVGPDGAVTGLNDQLIIRAPSERMQDIHDILQKIDRPPRRLMIYVRQGGELSRDHEQVNVGGTVEIDEQLSVQVGDNSTSGRVRSIRTRRDSDVTQYVQTVEGKPAFIAVGKQVPVEEQNMVISGGIIQHRTTTQYRDATTGFYVTPTVRDGEVILHISSHRVQSDARVHDAFEVGQTRTTIRGRMGQWIAVGGTGQTASRHESGISHRHITNTREDREIHLKVEELK